MTGERRALPKRALADFCVFLGGAIAVLYPVVLAHVRYGTAAPFKFFASDAFYYLDVARRSQGLPFYTYDGSHATNGFHPLWQWLLTWLLGVTHLKQASDQQLLLDYGACAALAAMAVGLLSVCACRLIGSRALALLFTIPGWFELLSSKLMTSTTDPTEAAPWYVVNGMESSLSLFWFGLVCWLALRRPAIQEWSLTRLVAASGLLSLLVLTRLDDFFLLVVFGGAALLTTRARQRPVQVALAVGTLPVLTLCGYVAYNVTTTRFMLPVSGSMKRDPGALAGNLRDALQTLIPTQMARSQQLIIWDGLNYRVLQLAFPMLVAGVFIAYCLFVQPNAQGAERSAQRSLLAILASYVLLKGGYNLVSVPLLSQGHWYFTLSIASANLMLTFLVVEVASWRRPQLAPDVEPRLRWLLRGVGISASLLGVTLASVAHNHSRLLFALAFLALPGALMALYADRVVALLRGVGAPSWRKLEGVLAAAGVAAFVTMYGNALVNQKVKGGYSDANFEFWQARHWIAAELARVAPTSKLLEYDDGVMAYALEVPTMSGTGLAIDADAYSACRAQHCIDVAYERGFRVISSVQYWGYSNEQRLDFRRPSAADEIVPLLVGPKSFEKPSGVERYDFSLILAANVGNHVVYFLKFKPKAAG